MLHTASSAEHVVPRRSLMAAPARVAMRVPCCGYTHSSTGNARFVAETPKQAVSTGRSVCVSCCLNICIPSEEIQTVNFIRKFAVAMVFS